MKKQILLLTLIATCLLCSCVKEPTNVTSTKKIGNTKVNLVSAEHILDDFDEAFETEYTKFKLPKKSDIIINQPKEVNKFEMGFVNTNKDMKWLKDKTQKLADIFGVKGKVEQYKDFRCDLKGDKGEVSADLFASPYFNAIDEKYDMNDIKVNRTDYQIKEKDKKLADKTVEYANEVENTFEGKLHYTAKCIREFSQNNENFYQVWLEANYMGVGIQSIEARYSSDEGENSTMPMGYNSIHILYNSTLKPIFFNHDEIQKVVSKNPIDKMISFKDACDILESTLSENIDIQFDDVKLWYSPNGETREIEKLDAGQTIKFKPKWFFVSRNDENSYYGIINADYISVDCETGDVDVCVP